MSIWGIAWRSIRQRGFASFLTAASMALGVMLVVMVLSIHGIVSTQFLNNANLGYNLIMGARGGKLQLTLNSVYYLSQPIENVPYDFYTEFFPEEPRTEMWRTSITARASRSVQSLACSLQSLSPGGGLTALAPMSVDPTAASLGLSAHDREGVYAQQTAFAVPLCLGDYFKGFRVVGTTPEFFDHLSDAKGESLVFREGRAFRTVDEENGYFEAVLGSLVALETQVQVGDMISPAHGDPNGEGHDRTFRVVGILDSSGTPNDRACFINVEGFYLLSNHAKPLEAEDGFAPSPFEMVRSEEVPTADDDAGNDGANPDEAASPDNEASPDASLADSDAEDSLDHLKIRTPLPLEQREVTAILVQTQYPYGVFLPNEINEGKIAQCVSPAEEIFGLLNTLVRPFQNVLLLLAVLICIVSGISILVSMYNSMSDRKQDIAVMRALGARRGTVMAIILVEALLLAMGGGLGGWIAGHAVNSALSGQIEARTGVKIGFLDFAPRSMCWN